jgi:hypothetical protein
MARPIWLLLVGGGASIVLLASDFFIERLADVVKHHSAALLVQLGCNEELGRRRGALLTYLGQNKVGKRPQFARSLTRQPT